MVKAPCNNGFWEVYVVKVVVGMMCTSKKIKATFHIPSFNNSTTACNLCSSVTYHRTLKARIPPDTHGSHRPLV